MAPGEKNEFLEISDSEDGLDTYNSDNEVQKGGRSAKRRRVASSHDEDASDNRSDASEGEGEDPIDVAAKQDVPSPQTAQSKKAPRQANSIEAAKPLTKKNLVASEAAIKKSGVVYMSRIPPGLKPSALRTFLAPYGKINRTFLAPEDPAVRARRRRAGGNRREQFTEGWIEFVRKKDAKAVCELLNGQNFGGKKRSRFRDDIWNLVYLKGFKWHNLTEQITAENAERTSRMRAEISKSTRENKEFVRNVERAKMLDGMQAKAKAKKRKAAADGEHGEPVRNDRSQSFAQVKQVNKVKDSHEEQPEHVTRVLSKIF